VPVITKILDRRKGAWVELFADQGGSLRLPVEYAAGLRIGEQVSDEQWERLRRESDYHLLFDKALRLLGLREHFALELRRKLALRSFDRPLVSRVIEACRERGYLDDARAADYTVQQVLHKGGIGRLKLKTMLKERGCPDELLESALAKFSAQYDEAEAARELLAARAAMFRHKRDRARQKLEERSDIDPRKIRMLLRAKVGQAVGTFLYARGFSGEEVNRAGRKLVDELLAEDNASEG